MASNIGDQVWSKLCRAQVWCSEKSIGSRLKNWPHSFRVVPLQLSTWPCPSTVSCPLIPELAGESPCEGYAVDDQGVPLAYHHQGFNIDQSPPLTCLFHPTIFAFRAVTNHLTGRDMDLLASDLIRGLRTATFVLRNSHSLAGHRSPTHGSSARTNSCVSYQAALLRIGSITSKTRESAPRDVSHREQGLETNPKCES